jgi:glutamine synthetase
VFVGEELQSVIDAIEAGGSFDSLDRIKTNLGISSIPTITKDSTDRNRTSPFAFTGNKFEFRMCGSAANIAEPCFTLNTVVADEIAEIADRLEKASDVEAESLAIIKEIIRDHKRIIFNGNNYAPEWVVEAARRGLPNIGSTVLAIDELKKEKNIAVFEKQGVLSRVEVSSRYEILLDGYAKIINIESLTAIDMVNRQLLPAALNFVNKLAGTVAVTANAGVESKAAKGLLAKVSALADIISVRVSELKACTDTASEISEAHEAAFAYREKVVPAMEALRVAVDELEPIVPADIWPLPVYADLLFRV